MLLNPRIQKAIYIATHQHRNQKRKMNDIPYIVHPFSVAWILSEQTKDDDVVIAGLLHDVIEDTHGYGYENIVEDFGDRVARFVNEVTEDKKLEWKDRKEKYIQNFENASEEVLMIATADKIHNLSSIYEGVKETGIDLFDLHFKSFKDSKWFYESMYNIMERRLENKKLLLEFKRVFDLVFK